MSKERKLIRNKSRESSFIWSSFKEDNSSFQNVYRPEFGSDVDLKKSETLWTLMKAYIPRDKKTIQQ